MSKLYSYSRTMEGAARRAQQRQPVAPIIEAPKPETAPAPAPGPSNVVKLMTILRVIDLVARMHGCTSVEMKGPGKTKRVVAGRDAAMCAVAVFKPHLSRGQIGLLFNRDPSTVLHALRKRGT